MKTVLVTGHSKGIGSAITNRLISDNNKVIGVSRTHTSDQELLNQFSVDLSNIESTVTLGKKLASQFDIDAIVLNAGHGQFGALENFSAKQIEMQIQLNLISPLVLLRALLPGLKKKERSNVVLIGSESAIQGGRFGSVYSASKFGLRGAAQALRHECAAANCRVGIINPGMVRTDFFSDLDFEPGPDHHHALLANDIAEAVVTMLNAPNTAVYDEIVINPLHHVVKKKST